MTEINDSLPVKEILTAAGPFIKTIVDTFITPRLEKLKKDFPLIIINIMFQQKSIFQNTSIEHINEFQL